jgi:hypothetical protein
MNEKREGKKNGTSAVTSFYLFYGVIFSTVARYSINIIIAKSNESSCVVTVVCDQ